MTHVGHAAWGQGLLVFMISLNNTLTPTYILYYYIHKYTHLAVHRYSTPSLPACFPQGTSICFKLSRQRCALIRIIMLEMVANTTGVGGAYYFYKPHLNLVALLKMESAREGKRFYVFLSAVIGWSFCFLCQRTPSLPACFPQGT